MKDLSSKQPNGLEGNGIPHPGTEDGALTQTDAPPEKSALHRLCVKLIKLSLWLSILLLLVVLFLGMPYFLYEKYQIGVLLGLESNTTVESQQSALSQRLQRELDDTRAEFRAVLEELNEANMKVDDWQKDHFSLSEEKTELETQLKQTKRNWDKLHDEYTDLIREKTDLQIELHLAKNNLDNLMSDHISLAGQKERLLDQLEQIQTNWEDLRSEYTSLSSEKIGVAADLDKVEKELEDLKDKHETLSGEKNELQNQLNQTKQNWEDVQNLYSVLLREKSHIQRELHFLQAAKNKSCADDWEYFRGKCYFFSYDWMNWTDSRDACVTMGGHLAIINTEEEQVFLSQSGGGYWIGLSDLVQEGEWRWMDNTALGDMGFWATGQPLSDDDSLDGKNEEDCVVLTWASKEWDDVLCRGQNKRICETKAAD